MSDQTYGDLTFDTDKSRWVITNLVPHVAIAFKRMFEKVPQMAKDIELFDSDENRADLEWFMMRYPLRHRYSSALAQGARRLARKAAERGRILAPDWTPGELVGFRPGEAPYNYQAQAAQIAVNQSYLLLADDVGLGKTVSAITAAVLGAPLPMAIVVQPHLTKQWKRQIQRFTGSRVHIVQQRAPYKLPPSDFFIFTYTNLCGWTDAFKTVRFPSVVWDEIQELRRGAETAKGTASLRLRDHASFRLGMSATPIFNLGDEMHTIMQYVNPDLLGPRDDFLREWCGGGRAVKDPEALGTFLIDSGYMLRRDEHSESVQRSMPPINIIDWEVGCDMEPIENEMEILRVLAQTVISGTFTEKGQATRALDLRMRQLTGIGKAKYVAAYIKLLLRESEKVVVAGWHREFYEILTRDLADYSPVMFTGSETPNAKDRNATEFIQGDARVLLMSLRSGAGLDGLQFVCNDAVLGELDWSPQIHKQFFGRLRRPGQTKQVNGHLLWTDFGSDPTVLEILGVKSDQGRGILDPGKAIEPRVEDTSRIRRLAEMILERTE